jgi:hypothetical protein
MWRQRVPTVDAKKGRDAEAVVADSAEAVEAKAHENDVQEKEQKMQSRVRQSKRHKCVRFWSRSRRRKGEKGEKARMPTRRRALEGRSQKEAFVLG